MRRLSIANGTDYALTAGLFSRSPANASAARRELLAGNLYLNRGITGAMVGRQPFGGFKLSGIGGKAGGPDYLLQFVLPPRASHREHALRAAFAPRRRGIKKSKLTGTSHEGRFEFPWNAKIRPA